MGRIYTAGEVHSGRRKWDLIVFLIIILLAIFAYLFIWWRSGTNTITVDNSNNQPQTRVIGAVDENSTPVDEPEFTLELPGLWEVNEKSKTGATYHYKASGILNNGRELEVFINKLPNDDFQTKVLPIEPDSSGAGILFNEISDQCRDFAPIEPSKITGVVSARWDDLEFDCDVHRYRNTVGTLNKQGGYYIDIAGNSGAYKLYLRYTDHGSRQNNTFFLDILRTFQAK